MVSESVLLMIQSYLFYKYLQSANYFRYWGMYWGSKSEKNGLSSFTHIVLGGSVFVHLFSPSEHIGCSMTHHMINCFTCVVLSTLHFCYLVGGLLAQLLDIDVFQSHKLSPLLISFLK